MGLMGSLVGMYGSVVSYILLHGIVKRQIFQISRYVIHGNGGQDTRENIQNNFIYMTYLGIFILSAIVVIIIAKELIVMNLFGFLIMIIVYISYIYTLVYV